MLKVTQDKNWNEDYDFEGSLEIIEIAAPHRATILRVHEVYHIIDGWNCGTITGSITFPGLPQVKRYLAGLWSTNVSEILVWGEMS